MLSLNVVLHIPYLTYDFPIQNLVCDQRNQEMTCDKFISMHQNLVVVERCNFIAARVKWGLNVNGII